MNVPSWRIETYDQVGSTMDEAAALAQQGAPSGTVVVARYQSAGRGRAGRSWTAPPDTALQMTVMLRTERPPQALGVLPLLVGVAVSRAIESVAPPLSCQLKWPNDLQIGGRKVGGILLTTKLQGDQTVLLIGIGVNVLGEQHTLPDGATSLAAELARSDDRASNTLTVAGLLQPVLDEFGAIYQRFLAGDFAADLADWQSRARFLHEMVHVVDAGQEKSGIFVGIDRDGALLLRAEDGSTTRVVVGDLTRGPRAVDAFSQS